MDNNLIFIIIISAYLLLCLISFYIKHTRSKRMADLAKEFGFEYTKSIENRGKNILIGKYNGKDFTIKDLELQTRSARAGKYYSVTSINGKEYRHFFPIVYFLPYLSINKIKRIIKGEEI